MKTPSHAVSYSNNQHKGLLNMLFAVNPEGFLQWLRKTRLKSNGRMNSAFTVNLKVEFSASWFLLWSTWRPSMKIITYPKIQPNLTWRMPLSHRRQFTEKKVLGYACFGCETNPLIWLLIGVSLKLLVTKSRSSPILPSYLKKVIVLLVFTVWSQILGWICKDN